MKKEADDLLVVDAGDDLTGPAVAPAARQARAKFFLAASAALGVDAMALGERDREPGVDLKGVKGSALVRRAGVPIGVFSMDLDAPDADKVLAREAARVRHKGAKLVVALIHGPTIKAHELLTSTRTPLDFAVLSHDAAWGQPLQRIGRTWVMQIASQGKFVGQLDLHILDGKLRFVDIGGRSSLELAAADTEREIADVAHKFPEGGPLADFGHKRRHELEEILASQRAEIAAYPLTKVTGSWMEAKSLPLGADIPDEPKMAAMLKKHKAEVSALTTPAAPPTTATATAAAAARPALGLPPGYAGTDACTACHPQAVKHWKSTKHALAWAALVRKESQADPSCVPCHVTGGTAAMVSVQCEACHGPSAGHVRTPETRGLTVRNPVEATCTTCHRKPQAQEWEFASFRKATLGKGHGLP